MNHVIKSVKEGGNMRLRVDRSATHCALLAGSRRSPKHGPSLATVRCHDVRWVPRAVFDLRLGPSDLLQRRVGVCGALPPSTFQLRI